jgi:hypothetical protein
MPTPALARRRATACPAGDCIQGELCGPGADDLVEPRGRSIRHVVEQRIGDGDRIDRNELPALSLLGRRVVAEDDFEVLGRLSVRTHPPMQLGMGRHLLERRRPESGRGLDAFARLEPTDSTTLTLQLDTAALLPDARLRCVQSPRKLHAELRIQRAGVEPRGFGTGLRE